MSAPVPLLYQLAADGLVVVHLLFVLFVITGGFLVLSNRKWAFVHLPAALWAATVEFTGWFCPLTPLENWLRLQGGGVRYTIQLCRTLPSAPALSRRADPGTADHPGPFGHRSQWSCLFPGVSPETPCSRAAGPAGPA